MSEPQLFEVIPARHVDGANFPLGVMDFPFSVGVPNVWVPSKSYFRVGMSVYGAPNGGAAAPIPREMVAFADNAVGNMFDNAYLRSNNVEISGIHQGLSQASALGARLGNTRSWLKSIGSGSNLNESSFVKRNMMTSDELAVDNSFKSKNEMYRPVADGYFGAAHVSISAATTTTLTALTGLVQAASTSLSFVRGPVSAVATDPVVLGPAPVVNPLSAVLLTPAINNVGAVTEVKVANNALATYTEGGVVTGVDTLFVTGMPNCVSGSPTGATVVVGDILVVNGMSFPIIAITGEHEIKIANAPTQAITQTVDWYIIRKDVMRAPQCNNTIYALWRPPIGIFDYDGALGSGEFRIQLNPNANYLNTAIETRNPDATGSVNGLTGDYSLVVNDIKFYAHMEKIKIPDQVQDLDLMECQVQSKPWAQNLQFTVSPYTQSLSVFVQDVTSGANPRVPPSMFKVLDNSDIKLSSIQVSYAGMTKPSTNWLSSFYNGADQLQQRYHDTYDQANPQVKESGCESYYDWLQRGPIYHFNFPRDMSNRATEVAINTVFAGLVSGPGTGTGSTGVARVFLVSHFPRRVQITTAAGSIVNVSANNR